MSKPPASSDNDALRAEFEACKTRIRAMPDRLEAIEEARKLGRQMAAFETEARLLREEITAALRKETGWSMQAIADKTGRSKGYVQNLLGKRPSPRKDSGEDARS